MITPFTPDGSAVSLDVTDQYVQFLIEKGVNGVFVAGTTGEGLLLSVEERIALFERVAESAKDRIAVIAHVGDVNTRNAVKVAQGARDRGIRAVSAVLPYFYPLDETAIFNHLKSIAESVPELAFYVYNIPGNTVNNFTPALFRRLANEVENFVGVKTSSPDFFLLKEYLYAGGDELDVFVGTDALDFPGLVCGAKGLISGNSSAFPEPFVRLYAAVLDGDLDTGRKMQKCIDELRDITNDGRYLSMFKLGLQMRGIPVGPIRGALRELTPEESERVKKRITEWAQRWEIEL
jgi:dihydrodipicolinate synthase/N-acetylneuraminate lyase